MPLHGWIHTGIVLAISLAFFFQLTKVTSGKQTCVAAYDGFGYYLYLAALADQGTVDVTKEWAQDLQDNYCGGAEAYQLLQRENGHFLNMYQMGLSVVLLPSFLVGHLWATVAGYPTDGMSYPYLVVFVLNAWLFALLGWFYLRKLLLLFFSQRETAFLVLLLLLGTNYFLTATTMFVLQHVYLFSLVAAFLYYFFRYSREGKYKYVAPILLGLIVLVRPTHIVLGLVPALLLFQKDKGFKRWMREMLPFAIAGFIWQIPQILYWRLVGGTWLEMNLHVNEIVLFDAHFADFLFSYRKGWLLYTPIFLLLPLGFWLLQKEDKRLFFALLLTTFLSIWLMAAWECWWYASSFGQRPVVDIYPMLILPLGFFLTKMRFTRWKIPVFVFVGMCFSLNAFQSMQFNRAIIADDRMTKDQYWATFGVLDPDEVNPLHLRVAETDRYWTLHEPQYRQLGYKLKKKVLLESNRVINCPAGKDWGFDHIELMKHLPTDETELKAEFSWEVDDTTGTASLCMEIANKHNVYVWNTIELAFQKPKSDSMSYQFTLPALHHQYDYLQIYLVNRTGKSIRLKHFKLTATSLIRP